MLILYFIQGSSEIEGIMLHPPMHEVVDQWANAAFEKMRNLKILIVRNVTFSTGPSYLPNSLRLLDWMGFPSKSFPPDFYPEKIVDFKLSHSLLMLAKPLQVGTHYLHSLSLSHSIETCNENFLVTIMIKYSDIIEKCS